MEHYLDRFLVLVPFQNQNLIVDFQYCLGYLEEALDLVLVDPYFPEGDLIMIYPLVLVVNVGPSDVCKPK